MSTQLINAFISRPNNLLGLHENRLKAFYLLLEECGFKANTIGQNQTPLKTPFQEVNDLMVECQCCIVLGLPQIKMSTGFISNKKIEKPVEFVSEWNQIEATISLMLKIPTLILLHKNVIARGLFDRGAANVFIHPFFLMDKDWQLKLKPALDSLSKKCCLPTI